MIPTKSVLYIDTSDREKTKVALETGKKRHEKSSPRKEHASQVVLSLIDEVLQEQNITIGNISGVKVHTGPGSFTGLRVGIAIANTLGFILGIKVNNSYEFVEPRYS